MTVRDVVSADTIGAHDDSEDAVVVEWTEEGPIMDTERSVTRGQVPRAVAISVSQFAELFEQEG